MTQVKTFPGRACAICMAILGRSANDNALLTAVNGTLVCADHVMLIVNPEIKCAIDTARQDVRSM